MGVACVLRCIDGVLVDDLIEADELSDLLMELERPLLPGFMTAGYSALGRYIFLAAEMRREAFRAG